MMDSITIRRLAVQGKYEYSRHAERERQIDMIFTYELEDALTECDIIESYPDDPRGPSCLVLGFSGQRPIHAVCTIRTNSDELLLITVYDPSMRPYRWKEGFRERR
ncbi:MAG: DUF4258 domain-containing protein [Pseudomonadota bacterium]